MQPVSSRWKAAVKGAPRWLPSVEYSNDGAHWTAVKIAGEAKVTIDAKSQVRWAFEGTVTDPGRDELHDYGTLLRVKVGLAYSPDDVEWLPLGKYRVDTASRAYRGRLVKVKGLSLEAAVIDDEFYAVRVIDGGSAQGIMLQLLRETLPEAQLSWLASTGATVGRITTKDTSRWSVIDGGQGDPSLARSVGARVFCNSVGAFVVRDVPSLADPPVGVVDEGPGGLLLSSQEDLTRKGVYNSVAVRGESTDGDTDPVGPCVVEDTDPVSPTFVGRSPLAGGFGRAVYHYSSQLITTEEQGYRAARGLLAPLLGLKQQISWEGVFDPSYEADDVVLVRSPAGLTPTLIDTVSYDLVAMSMDTTCRQTATRLAGDVTLPPESQEGA